MNYLTDWLFGELIVDQNLMKCIEKFVDPKFNEMDIDIFLSSNLFIYVGC